MHKFIILILIICSTTGASNKKKKTTEIKPTKEIPQYHYTTEDRDPFFPKPNKITPKMIPNIITQKNVQNKTNTVEAKDVLKALEEQYIITLLAVTNTRKLARIKKKKESSSGEYYREGGEITVQLDNNQTERLQIELIRGTPASIEFRWKDRIISLKQK